MGQLELPGRISFRLQRFAFLRKAIREGKARICNSNPALIPKHHCRKSTFGEEPHLDLTLLTESTHVIAKN